MPVTRSRLPVLGLAALAACAGVSPRPEAADASRLPTATPTAEEKADLAREVDACVRSVVQRHYDDAERSARAALAIDPRCARARAVVGMVMLQRARLEEPPDLMLANGGESETVLAEQLAPEDPFVGWMRAVFLAESGHMSAAAAAADAALVRTVKAPPDERAALLGVAGTYHYELGEERAALPLLQAYVGIRPEDATANFRIGSCLLRIAAVPAGAQADLVAQLQAEDAAKAFARCVELAPGDEDAALAIGTALLRAADLAGKRGDEALRDKRRAEAAAQFEKVASQFLGSAEACFRCGVVAEARGDRAAAEAAYGKALDRDGAHLGSLVNLAALLDRGDTRERALELWRRAAMADAAKSGLTAGERRWLESRLRETR